MFVKYYVWDGNYCVIAYLKDFPEPVQKLFKKFGNVPLLVYEGLCANPVEHYRAYQLFEDGTLKRLSGSNWNLVPYKVYLNHKAYILNPWKLEVFE